ncbi:conserved hypothetical protein [Culex quinquefasciatus]|uniref:Rho-GAP domain-containing protein n=1 Tax=Culex quinquefasciatus TaxID=7176 RepID=B0XA65_CULQU|nr:conserved hypothetical protein [Culex quinquefasciatus]|eukprot:XP_001866537.1 conserved hypothetical protein [Culex quinquefasciatus]
MSSWAQRMHRRAATLGSVVTSCGHPGSPYPHRLEKVKFGVPLDEVCKNDIPGPLLVLILKLNKEAPFRKDVFRAPGHQGAMKKLIHFLQQGRLVNVDNYSVYTIASVLKKFLRKIPGGVFGRDGETELFQIVDIGEEEVQQEKMHNRYDDYKVSSRGCAFRVVERDVVTQTEDTSSSYTINSRLQANWLCCLFVLRRWRELPTCTTTRRGHFR